MLLAATAMHEQDEQHTNSVRKSSKMNEKLRLLAYITDVVNSSGEVVTDDDQSQATNDTLGTVEQQQPLSPVQSHNNSTKLFPSKMFHDGTYTPLEKAAACLIQACKLRVEQQPQGKPHQQPQQQKKKLPPPPKKEAQTILVNQNKPKIKKKDMWVLSPTPPSVGGRNRSALRQKLEQQRNKEKKLQAQQEAQARTKLKPKKKVSQKTKLNEAPNVAAAAISYSNNKPTEAAAAAAAATVDVRTKLKPPQRKIADQQQQQQQKQQTKTRKKLEVPAATYTERIRGPVAAARKPSTIDDSVVVVVAAVAVAASSTNVTRTKRKRAPIQHFVAEPSRRRSNRDQQTMTPAIRNPAWILSNDRPPAVVANSKPATSAATDVFTKFERPRRHNVEEVQQPQPRQQPAKIQKPKSESKTAAAAAIAAVASSSEKSGNPSKSHDDRVVVVAAGAATTAASSRIKRKRAPVTHFVAEPSFRPVKNGATSPPLDGHRNDQQSVTPAVTKASVSGSKQHQQHPVIAAATADATTKPLSRTMQKFLARQQQQLEQLALRKQKTKKTGEDKQSTQPNELSQPIKPRHNSATKTEILPTKNISLLQKKKNFVPDQSTETPPPTAITTTNNTMVQKKMNFDPNDQSKTNPRTPTNTTLLVPIKGSLGSILDLSSTTTTMIPTSPPRSPNQPQKKTVPVAGAAAMIVQIKQQQQQSSMKDNKDSTKKDDEHIAANTKNNYASVVPVSPSKNSKDTLLRTGPKKNPAVPQKQQSKITRNHLHQDSTAGKDSADDTAATKLMIAPSRIPSPSRQPPKILALSPCLDIRPGRRQRDEQEKDSPRCVFATDASTTTDKKQQPCPSHLVPSDNDSTKKPDADRDNTTIVEPSQQEQPECHNGEHKSMTTDSMMTRIPVSRASSPSAELENDGALPTGAKDEQQRHQQPFWNKHKEKTTTIAKDATAEGADQDDATPPSAQSTITLFPPSSVLVIPILPTAGCATSQDEGQPHEELSSSTDENAGRIQIDQQKRTHRLDDDAHVADPPPNKVTNLSLTTKTIVTNATTTAGQHNTSDARTSSTSGIKKRKKRLSSMLAALAPHNKYGNSEDVVFDFTKLGGTESTATMMTTQKRQRRGCPTTCTNTKPTGTGVTTKDISATNSLRTTRRHRSRRLQ